MIDIMLNADYGSKKL